MTREEQSEKCKDCVYVNEQGYCWALKAKCNPIDEHCDCRQKEAMPLPPAEGAETILHRHIDKQSMDELSVNVWPDILEAMQEFASQQHPTAEGAEEILDGMDLGEPIQTGEFYYRSEVLKAMTEFATLHAQRIADKMVSERLREELIKYDKYIGSRGWIDNYEDWAAITSVDEYLKSREK